MKLINFSAILISLVFSTVTFAQYRFEGFYSEVLTGYEKNTVESVKLIGADYGQPPNTSTSASPSTEDASLVLGMGYRFKLKDTFILGLGIDYSTLNQTTRAEGFTYPGITNSIFNYEFSISNRFNIFLAPSYVIDEKKLISLKLGYSTQNVRYSQTNCCSTPSNNANVSGYVIGLGYKQFISNKFYGSIEANYYAYSNANMSNTYSDGPGGTVSAKPNLNAYNLLIGLGYMF